MSVIIHNCFVKYCKDWKTGKKKRRECVEIVSTLKSKLSTDSTREFENNKTRKYSKKRKSFGRKCCKD